MPDPRDYGLFIDGGVTPHNNPSFALLQMISLTPFKLCWTPGPDNLSVTSIGTGTYRPRLKYEDLGFTRYAQLALHALMSLMTDTEMMVLAQMQWLGECPAPWVINSEIGTLAGNGPPGGKLFKFMRYDVRLERPWLLKELELDVPEKDVERFRQMDDPGHRQIDLRDRQDRRRTAGQARALLQGRRAQTRVRRRRTPGSGGGNRKQDRPGLTGSAVRRRARPDHPACGWIGRWR